MNLRLRWLVALALACMSLCGLACSGNDDDDGGDGDGSDDDNDDDNHADDDNADDDDDNDDNDDSGSPIDLRADVNRDGVADLTDPTDDQDEETWDAAHGAVFLANIDDDPLRCPTDGNLSDVELAACNDATDEVVNGADDALDLAPLKIAPWPDAPEDAHAQFSCDAPDFVRLFRAADDDWTVVAFDDTTIDVSALRAGVDLGLEGKDIVRDLETWDGFADLTLRVFVGDEQIGEDVVRLRVSPVMTFHHLLDEDTVYALRIPNDSASAAYFADLEPAADEAGVALDDMAEQLEIHAIDQWTQDYLEFGYMSMPAAGGGQHVIHVAYRAANLEGILPNQPLRRAGRLAFTKFRGPDFAGVQEWQAGHNMNSDSLNSFGNWETIPPHSFGGADYPLGRLMVGATEGFAPDPKFLGMVEAQGMQPSVHIDTSWLIVGHVDETLSFFKVDNAKGWMLLVNDPTMAKQMLEDASADGYGDVLMFEDMKTMYGLPAQRTIDQVLADPDVMAESAESAVEVAAQEQTLRDAIGLEDADIIYIPYLHEPVMGLSLAYQPGTINSLYIARDLYAAPETHGPVIEGADIFKDQFEQALAPYGVGVAWVENWDLYHILWGEVHCGSNSLRATPDVKWWEVER